MNGCDPAVGRSNPQRRSIDCSEPRQLLEFAATDATYLMSMGQHGVHGGSTGRHRECPCARFKMPWLHCWRNVPAPGRDMAEPVPTAGARFRHDAGGVRHRPSMGPGCRARRGLCPERGVGLAFIEDREVVWAVIAWVARHPTTIRRQVGGKGTPRIAGRRWLSVEPAPEPDVRLS